MNERDIQDTVTGYSAPAVLRRNVRPRCVVPSGRLICGRDGQQSGPGSA